MKRHTRSTPTLIIIMILTGLISARSGSAPVYANTSWTGASTSGSGTVPWEAFTQLKLGAGMQLNANAVTGNLLLTVPVDDVPGVNNFDEVIRLAYNSLSKAVSTDLGNGWLSGTGRDLGLVVTSSTATFYDATGTAWSFTQPSACSFTPAAGVDASLVCNPSGYLLTENHSQEQFQFAASGYLSWMKDRQGNQIGFTYNGSNQLTQISNTEGQTTSLGYDSSGRISQLTDPAGHSWSFAYDSSGNLQQLTDAAHGITQFGYNSADLLAVILDPNGEQTDLSYNSANQITKVVRVTGGQNPPSWSFGGSPGTTIVTDPNLHQTTFSYDGSNRITAVKDAEGNTITTTWTTDNQVHTRMLPSGATTTFSYDSLNNLTETQFPSGATLQSQYSNSSFPYNPTQYTDAQGNINTYGYNAQGLVSTETDGSNHSLQVTYNSNGTVSTVTDPNQNLTSYGYTSQGLLNSVVYPVVTTGTQLGSQAYTYTADDLRQTFTDGKNQVTTYGYDSLNRLTSLSYADRSSIVYGYDPDGNQTSLKDSSGTTTNTYNTLNQEVKQLFPSGQSVTYQYDGVNNLLTKTDAGGQVKYTHYPDNQVETITDPGSINPISFQYDMNDNRSQIAYPNGVTENLSYDSNRDLTSIVATKGSQTLDSFTYSYLNTLSNQQTLVRQTMTDMAGNVWTYSYDQVNRVTGAIEKNSGGGTIASYAYGYDPASNLTNLNGQSQSYNQDNELVQAGNLTLSRDADGNLTGSSGGASFTYNAQNQLTSFVPSIGGQSTSMTYSDQGEAQRITEGASSFQYDSSGLSIAAVSGGSTTFYTRTPDGLLLDQRIGTSPFYYLSDGNGSVVGLTDSTGKQQDSYAYDPFGKLTSSNTPINNLWTFQGSLGDSVLKLYKMGARYDDPSTGTWTQPDPAEYSLIDPASVERFVFVGDDPVNFVDLSGTCSPTDYLFAGLGIAGGIFGVGVAVFGAPETGGLSLYGGLFFATASVGGAYYLLSQCS